MNHEAESVSSKRHIVGFFSGSLLLLLAFTTGFITGVISDGTAEVINSFNAQNPQTRARISHYEEQQQNAPHQINAIAKPEPANLVVPKDNGTIDWKISVAPGTQIAELMVDAKNNDQPMRLRFSQIQRGHAPSEVATLWLQPKSTAAISLPAGYYRVGSTQLGPDVKWDERAGDEGYLERPLNIRILDPDESPASLKIAEDGTLSSKAMIPKQPSAQKRKKRPKAEYEGLGKAHQPDTDQSQNIEE